jgi:hypothetical protein
MFCKHCFHYTNLGLKGQSDFVGAWSDASWVPGCIQTLWIMALCFGLLFVDGMESSGTHIVTEWCVTCSLPDLRFWTLRYFKHIYLMFLLQNEGQHFSDPVNFAYIVKYLHCNRFHAYYMSKHCLLGTLYWKGWDNHGFVSSTVLFTSSVLSMFC